MNALNARTALATILRSVPDGVGSAPVNAPAPTTPPAAPVKPATAAIKAAVKAKAVPKAPAKAAPAKAAGKVAPAQKSATGARVRTSRVAAFYVPVLELLRGGAKSVTAMAAKVGIEERDVRLAIDRARSRGHKIDRTTKGTFAFRKGYKVPANDKL